MANLTNTSKSVNGVVTPTKITVGTSGDTLTFTSGTAQELVLYNTSASSVNVTITGSTATTVKVPGAGAATYNVAAGLVVPVAANSFAFVPMDSHSAFFSGTISIVAATGAVVQACMLA
jgi:hypothetical protein